MFKSLWEKLRRIYVQTFTSKKFLKKDRDSVGGKTVGEVYDIEYQPSSENPESEMMLIFNKKDDK